MDPAIAAAFYDASGFSERNDPDSPASAFAVDRIRDELARVVRTGARALDLGCNAGRFTFALEELGAVATGVDCAPIPIEHARSIALARRSRATFVVADVAKLPFDDATFDLVLLPNNLVEFRPDEFTRVAGEVSRVMVPDGVFVLDFVQRTRKGYSGVSRFDVPGRGEFEYRWHEWTIGQLRDVCGRVLVEATARRCDDGRWVCAFRKEPQDTP